MSPPDGNPAVITPVRKAAVAVGWAGVALIVALSLGPPPTVGADVPMADKWGHALAYGGVMAWFCGLYPRLRVQLAYLAGFFALGVALELIQGLLPPRQASVLDAAANLTGLMLALVVMRIVSSGSKGD